MNGLLDKLLQADLRDVWPFVLGVLKDPGTDRTAFIAILGVFAIITLLVVLVLVLVFMSVPEDEEEMLAEDEQAPAVIPVVEEDAFVPETDAEAPDEKPVRRISPLLSGVIWAGIFAIVWMAGGVVSSRDVMCLSCHGDKPFHVVRADNPKLDPHSKVLCVDCHESPNVVVRITTAVPARAVHFLGGVTWEKVARGYGTPVANKSCAGCHQTVLATTITDPVRGLRVSHVAPLKAKARCSECHATHADTGITNRFTVGMVPCLRCHDNTTASAKCEYCHTKDIAFAVSSRGVVQSQSHDIAWDCSACHKDQTRCDNCHHLRMPHTQAFMNGGHARIAAEDIWFNNGNTCKRCHTAVRRPCANCHVGRFPSHGSPSWAKDHQAANPLSNGCDACHGYRAWIQGRNFCENCHPGIASSKAGAKK